MSIHEDIDTQSDIKDKIKRGKGKLAKLLESNNNRLYKLMLVLLAGICMIIIAMPVRERNEDTGKDSWTNNKNAEDSADEKTEGAYNMSQGGDTDHQKEYTRYMEDRLKSVLEKMEGVSDVSVMITVKNSGEKIALRDKSTDTSEGQENSQQSSSEETVMQNMDSSTVPYITQYREPEIEGVAVCCKGAENGEISLKITNAVQALFDVPTHKIVILEAN